MFGIDFWEFISVYVYITADPYSSNIGLDDEIDLEDTALNQADHLPKDNKSYVIFDLETTGLGMWNACLKCLFFFQLLSYSR